MNTIGNNIKITFFGESHGPYIGVVIDNLPAGLEIDEAHLGFNLEKRRPAKKISTTRIEPDNFRFVSGYFEGKTTGGPLTILIDNVNVLSGDYENLKTVPRPSHADYPAYIKYSGNNDVRGGGFFSGRLTALWVVVGSICEQILQKQGIIAGSHIYSLKNIKDTPFNLNENDVDQLATLNSSYFPVIDASISQQMYDLITQTKMSSDSVGGIIETKVINLPVGLGEPYFLSTESYIASLLFSIPGVKGVEFGSGFSITERFGSEANDQYCVDQGKISTKSNHNGGILGGLTTGRPLILRVALKPTSSIAKVQASVDLETQTEVALVVKGRHDPQIVSRASHVVNAVVNYAILDLLLFQDRKDVF